jgi:hypothetical protein
MVVNVFNENRKCRRVGVIPALLSALFLLAPEVQAAVTAKLDRSRIVEGETVTLTITTDNARQNLDADFSAIEREFDILDRRSETQLSIVEGKQTAVVRLLLTMEPRRSGDLTVPALSIAGSVTRPLPLQVDPAPELQPGELPPVFIEVEVTPRSGPYYVHAQFGLVVRVFYQQNLTEAAISPPQPDPASVRLLQETPYQADRGGERYRVLERNYAIFPERSGILQIPAMQLSGRLVERRNSGAWQPTVRGRRISVESEAIQLDILPRPAAFTGDHWQPAREFRITQQISSGESLRVGEPVTRTVIIDVVGLEENMIAEPRWPKVADSRIYPDQPQGITRDDGNWVLGHKEFRYAIVPEKAGELELPELTVHWWDTAADVERTAALPAHTLRVNPSSLTPPVAQAMSDAAAPAVSPGGGVASESRTSAGYWPWVTLFFAFAWTLTLMAFWRLRRALVTDSTGAGSWGESADETEILAQLKHACRQDRLAEARVALGNWLKAYGTLGNRSILEFAALLEDEALKESLREMDSAGFRPQQAGSWEGREFWSAFDTWRRSTGRLRSSGQVPLTDLYARENRKG